ncbi:hypothetical protein HMSSN036_89110 [Paenibacillus macerans]|nr:hypothetical protein HMSSN036_89110 [Paenibacillus macerans]
MRKVKVAATQMSCSPNTDENIAKADKLVREAARQGAQIILLQELFETPYFCQKKNRTTTSMPPSWRRTRRSGIFARWPRS